jgi:hypothetical protein
MLAFRTAEPGWANRYSGSGDTHDVRHEPDALDDERPALTFTSWKFNPDLGDSAQSSRRCRPAQRGVL